MIDKNSSLPPKPAAFSKRSLIAPQFRRPIT
jgi:hypothetical protein